MGRVPQFQFLHVSSATPLPIGYPSCWPLSSFHSSFLCPFSGLIVLGNGFGSAYPCAHSFTQRNPTIRRGQSSSIPASSRFGLHFASVLLSFLLVSVFPEFLNYSFLTLRFPCRLRFVILFVGLFLPRVSQLQFPHVSVSISSLFCYPSCWSLSSPSLTITASSRFVFHFFSVLLCFRAKQFISFFFLPLFFPSSIFCQRCEVCRKPKLVLKRHMAWVSLSHATAKRRQ